MCPFNAFVRPYIIPQITAIVACTETKTIEQSQTEPKTLFAARYGICITVYLNTGTEKGQHT